MERRMKTFWYTLSYRKGLFLLLPAAMVIVLFRVNRSGTLNRREVADSGHPGMYDVGRVLRQRRNHMKKMCIRDKHHEDIQHFGYTLRKRLSRNDEHKLLFCGIEKIGSSFWKRIFKVLVDKKKKGLRVFDMPYFKAHNGIPPAMSMKEVPEEQVRSILSSYKAFMFTRDPFSRLFSGYVDKLVLPGLVGDHYADAIKKKFKKKMPDLCPYNVTFDMMCTFVADAILIKDNRLEGHFSPAYEHCQPCSIDYTFIGKMESFMNDTKYILSSASIRLADVTGEKHEGETDEMNDKGTISDLASLAFDYIAKNSEKMKCLKKKDILHRLWKVYQIRGVISKKDKLPRFNNVENLQANEFIGAAHKIYDESDTPRDERQAQRDEALMEAFSTLPGPLLGKLAQAFAQDCKMFNYDCDVTSRFPNYNSNTQRQSHKFSYLKFNT